jgi:hypothetical protein
MSRTDWGRVLDESRDIVESYDTAVTLRQLFYRLVARLVIPNTVGAYKGLSRVTADARRDGDFPDLTDRTREIFEYQTFTSPARAIGYTAAIYRRDRTEGQEVSIYLGVEKDGMVNQLDAWFSDLGLPILSPRGYASQSYVDEVARHVADVGRPAVLVYAGDHDPTGHDIDRDFAECTGCFEQVRRIALGPELVEQYDLPEAVDNDPLTAEKLERTAQAAGPPGLSRSRNRRHPRGGPRKKGPPAAVREVGPPAPGGVQKWTPRVPNVVVRLQVSKNGWTPISCDQGRRRPP